MVVEFVSYPKCSTCKKAENWLKSHNIEYKFRDIKEDTPTFEELAVWYKMSGLPLKAFINHTGFAYKELDLKNRLSDMSEEEVLRLLAANGMLIKRPVIFSQKCILAGFKAGEWERKLLK